MPFQTESAPRRSAGPAIAAAVAGAVLGGALALAAGAVAGESSLPSEEQVAVSREAAFLGSVQYGERFDK